MDFYSFWVLDFEVITLLVVRPIISYTEPHLT